MRQEIGLIEEALEKRYKDLIALEDYKDSSEENRRNAFLTRALSAHSLTILAEINDQVAAEHVVDGNDDNGIDAIYVDEINHIVYLIQSKFHKDGSKTIDWGEVKRFIDGCLDLVNCRFEKFNKKTNEFKNILGNELEGNVATFILVIAHTGGASLAKVVKNELEEFVRDQNEDNEYMDYKILSKKDFINSLIMNPEQNVDLIINLKDWGLVKSPYKAYYGRIDAEAIASWHSNLDLLFSRNLRKFKGLTEVNDAIVSTLVDKPDAFWYFNNGITMLCKQLSKARKGGSGRKMGRFICKGVSIVNGAQTVGSIIKAYAKDRKQLEKAQLLIRLISLENCPKSFSGEVTRATNTQNKIELRDFVALDPEQLRLKKEFLLAGKEYVYMSGDPQPDPDEGCDLLEATVALACAHPDLGLAVQAKREISKLWENIEASPYKLIFNKSLSATYLWRMVQIHRKVESILKNEQAKRSERERLIVIHGNRFILHHVFRLLNREKLDNPVLEFKAIENAVSKNTIDILNITTSLVNSMYPNSYLNSLFKNRTKCQDLSNKILDK